jgi:hypothetical protein
MMTGEGRVRRRPPDSLDRRADRCTHGLRPHAPPRRVAGTARGGGRPGTSWRPDRADRSDRGPRHEPRDGGLQLGDDRLPQGLGGGADLRGGHRELPGRQLRLAPAGEARRVGVVLRRDCDVVRGPARCSMPPRRWAPGWRRSPGLSRSSCCSSSSTGSCTRCTGRAGSPSTMRRCPLAIVRTQRPVTFQRRPLSPERLLVPGRASCRLRWRDHATSPSAAAATRAVVSCAPRGCRADMTSGASNARWTPTDMSGAWASWS